ncbi:MAG: hypothetical protein DI629_21355 [Mesorhizobium amorphae]|nr:MAG: hypothetical protein DI629_21355 [Mesorhizobium amorphae]
MARAYGYYINLDERGSFHADVRGIDGKTILEVRAEGEDPELVEDGFMSDRHDVSGLEAHMREVGLIGENDRVLPFCEFENAPFIDRSGDMISEDDLDYRDGFNYKRTGHALLDGAVTPDLERRLALAIDHSEFEPAFIPAEVGFGPHVSPDDWDEEIDHPFCVITQVRDFDPAADNKEPAGAVVYGAGSFEDFVRRVEEAPMDQGWRPEGWTPENPGSEEDYGF